MSVPDAEYTRWIGRTETTSDLLAPTQAAAAAAMFDLPASMSRPGAPMPPLWHWFYFLSHPPQATLAADGHARRGGFLPPIELPHRMFAGGRLTFHAPLLLGTPAERTTTILDMTRKAGRSGSLAFVRVGYRYDQGGTLCIEEEQDIVYREGSSSSSTSSQDEVPGIPAGARTRTFMPDSRLLFRFSALTFNAHRIHYDREYARLEGGYPGLVVHGPLLAMLLISMATSEGDSSPDRWHPPKTFAFRSERPLFDLHPVVLHATTAGETILLEARGPDGVVAQRASATLE